MRDESAEFIIKKKTALFTDLETWKARWDYNGRYCAPQVDIYSDIPKTPDRTGYSGVFDTTALDALDSYATGLISEIFPANEKWMVWAPEDSDEADDAAKKWYARCGEIALLHLARSRFYQQLKPAVTDMGYAGTAALALRKGTKSLLQFSYVRLGYFAIEEDGEGSVTALYRELRLNAEQMADMFGEKNLGDSARKALMAIKDGKTAEHTEFRVIHAVFPREDRDESSPASTEMEWASVYVCQEDKHVLERGGYEHFPYACIRAERWNDYVYGNCPANRAMPAIRQLNKLARDMDEGAALAVRPPWIVPAGMVGEVAAYPNGVTVYDERKGQGGKPEQLLNRANYTVGEKLMEGKKAEVRAAFHAALFESIAQKDKQMTAREVAALEAGALRKFLPNFNQLTSEMQSIFSTVFTILFEAGVFPEPPASVVQILDDGSGFIAAPKVEFTSRIALAMRMVENSAIDRTLERLFALAPVAPEILENFDMDEMIRQAGRNDGLPEDVLKLKTLVERERQARQQQEQAMMQAALVEQAANVAKTVGDTDGVAAASNIQQLAGAAA